MPHTPHSKQFEIVRHSGAAHKVDYILDGNSCPACNLPTVIFDDPNRRYCTSKGCNAFILEHPVVGTRVG